VTWAHCSPVFRRGRNVELGARRPGGAAEEEPADVRLDGSIRRQPRRYMELERIACSIQF
jgi:hypothetical protein